MAITTFTDSDYSALFKRTYGEYGDNLYGSGAEDPLESQLEKIFDFGGTDHRMAIKAGFGGGTSFGTLGQANTSKNLEVILTRKSAYARMNLNRETIVASRGKASAFIEATKEETLGKLKSFVRTQATALYNDGSGILGQHSGNFGGTDTAPIATILITGSYQFRQGFFEEGDYLNVVKSGTTVLGSVFEVSAVNTTTGVVTLARLPGGLDDLTIIGAGTHNLVLQNSVVQVSTGVTASKAPSGLKGAADFTSGSLYGVAFQRRWSPYRNPLSVAQLISVDLLNKAMLQIDQRAGESPNLLIFSTIQMEKLLNQLEDKKRYTNTTISSRDNKMMTKAGISFSAIEYMSVRGALPIVSSRYVRDDTVYLVNTNKMFRKHAEKFGWFDEDRTVLLRMQDQDAYEARYGGYYENYFNPLHVGMISNLAV